MQNLTTNDWRVFQHPERHTLKFKSKTMKYNYSCFPCCVQIILANMGVYGEIDDIEDQWNTMHQENTNKDLNTSAPDEDEILNNLKDPRYPLKNVNRFHFAGPSSFIQNDIGNAEDHANQMKQEIEHHFFCK